MTDNRVLYYRPPPINDVETYIPRWQRATLSYLRSGHCKLLNSYKKRLKQTDSSSCPDCGMDPHDVPHLFNCTAYPIVWTPENLWDIVVMTIRDLSFLEPGLTTRVLKRAYNNNNSGVPMTSIICVQKIRCTKQIKNLTEHHNSTQSYCQTLSDSQPLLQRE